MEGSILRLVDKILYKWSRDHDEAKTKNKSTEAVEKIGTIIIGSFSQNCTSSDEYVDGKMVRGEDRMRMEFDKELAWWW